MNRRRVSGETTSAPERFVFVRDGFYFWAFLLAPLWLLLHGLWLALAMYVVGYGIVTVGLAVLHASANAQFLVGLLIALFIGFEAPSIWRWTLGRRGWTTLGFVVGEDTEIAEQRFFSEWTRRTASRLRRYLRPNPGMRHRCGVDPRRRLMLSACFPSRELNGESVAIVDYGSGNLHSAAKAFERAARESGSGERIAVTSDPDAIIRADRIVLPGVGAFADCRRGLDEIPGMVDALEQSVRKNGRPFFGICVGMQLMAECGREYKVTPGLGWIAGEVDRIRPSRSGFENSAYGLEHA